MQHPLHQDDLEAGLPQHLQRAAVEVHLHRHVRPGGDLLHRARLDARVPLVHQRREEVHRGAPGFRGHEVAIGPPEGHGPEGIPLLAGPVSQALVELEARQVFEARQVQVRPVAVEPEAARRHEPVQAHPVLQRETPVGDAQQVPDGREARGRGAGHRLEAQRAVRVLLRGDQAHGGGAGCDQVAGQRADREGLEARKAELGEVDLGQQLLGQRLVEAVDHLARAHHDHARPAGRLRAQPLELEARGGGAVRVVDGQVRPRPLEAEPCAIDREQQGEGEQAGPGEPLEGVLRTGSRGIPHRSPLRGARG